MPEPETNTERVAVVVWRLTQGGAPLTTREAARLTGLTMPGALGMLQHISRVLPIYQDGVFWRVCHVSAPE